MSYTIQNAQAVVSNGINAALAGEAQSNSGTQQVAYGALLALENGLIEIDGRTVTIEDLPTLVVSNPDEDTKAEQAELRSGMRDLLLVNLLPTDPKTDESISTQDAKANRKANAKPIAVFNKGLRLLGTLARAFERYDMTVSAANFSDDAGVFTVPVYTLLKDNEWSLSQNKFLPLDGASRYTVMLCDSAAQAEAQEDTGKVDPRFASVRELERAIAPPKTVTQADTRAKIGEAVKVLSELNYSDYKKLDAKSMDAIRVMVSRLDKFAETYDGEQAETKAKAKNKKAA